MSNPLEMAPDRRLDEVVCLKIDCGCCLQCLAWKCSRVHHTLHQTPNSARARRDYVHCNNKVSLTLTSSSTKIFELLNVARARQTNCRWPTLKRIRLWKQEQLSTYLIFSPPSEILCSNPFVSVFEKLWKALVILLLLFPPHLTLEDKFGLIKYNRTYFKMSQLQCLPQLIIGIIAERVEIEANGAGEEHWFLS